MELGATCAADGQVWSLLSLKEYVLAVICDNDRRHTMEVSFIRDLMQKHWKHDDERFAEAAARGSEQVLAGDRRIMDVVNAQKEAVLKSEASYTHRFDAGNEFRASLSDQQRLMIPRIEVEGLFRASENRMLRNETALREQAELISAMQATAAGAEKGYSSGWATAVAVVGMIATVMSVIALAVSLLKH